MPDTEKTVRRLRCPVCLLNGKDPPLAHDAGVNRYYCQVCCFDGTEAEVDEYYAVFRRKYRQLSAPLNLKKI